MTLTLATFFKSFRIFAFVIATTLFAGIAPPAHAVGTDTPPPADDKDKKDKKAADDAQQQLAHERFLRGYRAARDLILAGDYQRGIAALHALGRDDHPDVANYIGYANRKLGNYDASQHWYEKALAAAPDHVRTWSYYGMWHMEQGNRLKAIDYLDKVNLLCGNTACEEYRQLKAVIDGKASY